MIDPFKNLQVNLRAAGPAAVLCVLFISIASVGVFGHGPIAEEALNLLIKSNLQRSPTSTQTAPLPDFFL